MSIQLNSIIHGREEPRQWTIWCVFYALLRGRRRPSGGLSHPGLPVLALGAQKWAGWKWPGGYLDLYWEGNPLDKPGRRIQCFCSERVVDMSSMVRRTPGLFCGRNSAMGHDNMWNNCTGSASLMVIKLLWDDIRPHQASELHKHSTKACEENCLLIVCFSLMILNSPCWSLLSCHDYLFFCFVLVG